MGLAWSATSWAATTVHFGSIRQIEGPSDLDLEGDFAYAINFSADDPPRRVGAVTFRPDHLAIPGALLVGPQQVLGWQEKPEFGSSADANQLEEICHDIRWAEAGSGQRLRATLAVTAGDEYKLQILISGNTGENRRWDIRVNARSAVDEITSLGRSPGESYARGRASLYTCQFVANSGSAVVEMGNLFGANDGGDRNPIWQALTLERVTVPASPQDVVLDSPVFFPEQPGPIGRLRVVDSKPQVTHTLELVAGAGDQDNGKFVLVADELRAGAHDFSADPVGTAFSIRVRATDTADGSRTFEKSITLTLIQPSAPTALSLDVTSMTFPHGAGKRVARVRAEDPDSLDQHEFVLTPGTNDLHNGLLEVRGDEIRLAEPLPAGLAEVRFRLRATDRAGLFVEEAFVLPLIPARVRIHELIATGASGLGEGSPESQEWLELHNELGQYVDLTGWYLSDSPNDPRRWAFPEVTLGPEGFLVVLLGGVDSGGGTQTELRANFSLSAAGETVSLVRPDGVTVMDSLTFPALFPGVSYGRGTNGILGHLVSPTPALPNTRAVAGGENAVTYSVTRGFYSEAFDLELAATLPGSVVRYTTDGTPPGPTTGLVYSGPIRVTPATTGATRGTRIIRAMAIHAEAAYAPIATHTYLFIEGVAGPGVDGVVSQSRLLPSITRHAVYGPLLGDAFMALPAVSVILPSGPNSTERPASVELFDPGLLEPGFQIDCGIESTGTTSLGSPKLSMSAKFRAKYGQARLRYPVFERGSMVPRGAAVEFDELRIRSHSHDTFYWLGTRENPPTPYGNPAVLRSGDAQLIRNLWIDEMQLVMGQPGKRGRQVHLFLNGSYHGIYHVHEHADDDFMASYFPGASEDFHFTGAATTGSEHEENNSSWRTTWNQVRASVNNYAQARRWIDVTNLCDYMVLSFYAGNDWDWSTQHNWAAAGPVLPDRGGWKFFQQDSDITLQDVNADCTDQDVPDGIFNALMRFPEFRVLFRDRLYLHCYGDGALTPTRAAAFYRARMEELSTALIAETARWQPSSSVGTLPWDRDQEWMQEWQYLRDTFFPQRTAKLIEQVRRHAGWWPVEPPVLSLPPGGVPPNVAVQLLAATGTVYFTTDGSDPRLPDGRIHPQAQVTGGGVTRRQLIPPGSVWRFLDNGTDPGSDWMTEGYDDRAWKSGPAEIGYGDGNEATRAVFVDTDLELGGVQKNLTTYFRRTFTAPSDGTFSNLHLRLLRDDGAVVYLNGREVWRDNMPTGPVTPLTRAIAGIGGSDESTFIERTLEIGDIPLRADGNVLAVEIHQQTAESTDISFDFELAGIEIQAPTNNVLLVDRPLLIRARSYSGSEWSALVEAYYTPLGLEPASAASLVVDEIHYHPLEQGQSEFVEFLNTSPNAIDLSGVRISGAVSYVFPLATVLGGNDRLVVVADPLLFDATYSDPASPYFRPGIRRFGPWTGSLSNAGERMDVVGAGGSLLFSCTYGTENDWPGRADGRGSSLELVNAGDAPRSGVEKSVWLSVADHWRPSSEFHGSPGAAGAGPDRRIVINEVLASSRGAETDAVELLNRTDSTVDLSGWVLSDSSADYRKYRFPEGTVLLPGARKVLRENDFNNPANPANPVPFALSSQGDDVFLVEANAAGALLRFVDRVEFGAVPSGVALGRYPDGVGPFVWLSSLSLGSTNPVPMPGYDAWAAVSFSADALPEALRPDADPDGDGLPNFAEYAFGLRPDRPGGPRPLAVGDVPWQEGLLFAYRARPGAEGLEYVVEVSADLETWHPAGSQVEFVAREALADGSDLVTARLHAGAGYRFVRVGARGSP